MVGEDEDEISIDTWSVCLRNVSLLALTNIGFSFSKQYGALHSVDETSQFLNLTSVLSGFGIERFGGRFI